VYVEGYSVSVSVKCMKCIQSVHVWNDNRASFLHLFTHDDISE